MMSARDQRAETFKIQQDGGTKDGRKDKLKGKKFLNIKRIFADCPSCLFCGVIDLIILISRSIPFPMSVGVA